MNKINDLIGKEIRFLVFYKEFKKDDIILVKHSKYETSKVLEIIEVVSDYKEGWSYYKLLMESGVVLNYFSPKFI
jgi:hypothetical protein